MQIISFIPFHVLKKELLFNLHVVHMKQFIPVGKTFQVKGNLCSLLLNAKVLGQTQTISKFKCELIG